MKNIKFKIVETLFKSYIFDYFPAVTHPNNLKIYHWPYIKLRVMSKIYIKIYTHYLLQFHRPQSPERRTHLRDIAGGLFRLLEVHHPQEAHDD